MAKRTRTTSATTPTAPSKADRIDGYDPTLAEPTTPEYRGDLQRLVATAQSGRMDALLEGVNFDAFINELTGLGTTWGDKTRGGLPGGPRFGLNVMGWAEAAARYRGSDLGRAIVERIPDEMTRRGWDLEVQPAEDDLALAADAPAHLDACMRQPARAAAGWRAYARRFGRGRAGNADAVAACMEYARRWDEYIPGVGYVPNPRARKPSDPSGGGGRGGGAPDPLGALQAAAQAAPPPPPGPLPRINDEGQDLIEAMEKWATAIGLQRTVNQALRLERAAGGAAIFIGADDGATDLTAPLNPDKIKRITHVTAFRGGYDGEVVAWRPYNDPRHPKYGQPEIYQLRNTSVQVARPPAPGEGPVSQQIPSGPGGATIWWVHESRLLVFDGEPVSREEQQAMRGWGDSIFTRINDPLMQYEQAWNAVAVLLQEFSISTLAIKGFAEALAKGGAKARDKFLETARLQALVQSVARMRYVDAEEKFDRTTASVAGIADILREWAVRLAATADTPASVLFGKLAGGLGSSEDPSIRSWYDRIEGRQENRLRPALEYLYRLGWRAKNSPTRGHEPERWALLFRPLWQLTELEKADLRLKTSQADASDITSQVVTPEEVAATRYGGVEYNPGPIVLDMDARRGASAAIAPPRPPGAPAVPGGAPHQPGPPQGTPAAAAAANAAQQQPNGLIASEASPEVHPTTGAGAVTVPPMTAMPSDPMTGDPQATPSTVTETGAGGRPLVRRGDDLPDEDDAADPSTWHLDEPEHAPAGTPDGGQFVGKGGGGEGGSEGNGGGSLKQATLSQLSVRLARLAKANRGAGDPEYTAIVKELKGRKIKSFGALEKAIAAGK